MLMFVSSGVDTFHSHHNRFLNSSFNDMKQERKTFHRGAIYFTFTFHIDQPELGTRLITKIGLHTTHQPQELFRGVLNMLGG